MTERREQDPELFKQSRVRKDVHDNLFKAQEFYKSPLLNQVAVTIKLALIEEGLEITPLTKDREPSLALNYEQEGIEIYRYQDHGTLTDIINTTFPPQELRNHTDADRFLDIRITTPVAFGNGTETTVNIYGKDKVQDTDKPFTRVVSGMMRQQRTQIRREQSGIGIDQNNPTLLRAKTDYIHLYNQDIPPFDYAKPQAFFDFIFAVPPHSNNL